MITDELLLENGYREWEPNIFHRTAKRMFQKKFKNNKGQTKYFITIYEYEAPDGTKPIYNVKLQFEKENYTMDITLFALYDMTLEKLEQEVYKIWWELDCKYYEC